MQLGFIGLGRMGSRMVMKLLQEEHGVVVWNRSQAPIQELQLKVQSAKFKVVETTEQLVQSLESPRVIWVMVTAGEATQTILDEVSQYLDTGDILIDGGNAFYKDTERRFKEFEQKGIKYLGIGVSGGLIAATDGYPLMVGGDRNAYGYIKQILDSLAKPRGGHEYFGTGGAGHFVKMVHNGIEYGYMQSIGEGFGVLEKSEYELDLLKVAKLYQKGTLVSGFMMDRTVDALLDDSKLSNVVGLIGESSDRAAQHTVEAAKEQGLPVGIIEQSLEFRRKSQTDETLQKTFAAKLVAALRLAFGGHAITKKPDQ